MFHKLHFALLHPQKLLFDRLLLTKCNTYLKSENTGRPPNSQPMMSLEVQFCFKQNWRQLLWLLRLGRLPATEPVFAPKGCSLQAPSHCKYSAPFTHIKTEKSTALLLLCLNTCFNLHYAMNSTRPLWHTRIIMSHRKFISIFIVFRNPRIKSFFFFF